VTKRRKWIFLYLLKARGRERGQRKRDSERRRWREERERNKLLCSFAERGPSALELALPSS
jgi:hypothetical protein